MDWNSKASSEWDWENLAMFGGKAAEIPGRVQLSIHEIEGDGVDSVSIYSSGDGGFSGSDLGYGSSSKSPISASAESSLKEEVKMKTFQTVDCLPKDLIDKEQFSSAANNENFHAPGAPIGSGEPVIGLKLGKRTYFEDMCVASSTKTTSVPGIPKAFAATTKRTRVTYQSTQTPHCQVEGCKLDLKSAKDYHRRHRICENHSKSPKVIVAGMERRFCQQCSRFHDISEFDDKKRSCRRRLSDHNARRRRPQPEATQFNSARLSSSLYDGRQHLLMNRVPIPVSNPAWPSACSFKVTHVRDSFISPAKAGGFDRQPHLSSDEMLNAISLLHLEPDRVFSLQSTTPNVLNHGLEASTITSTTLNVAPDIRRVLSLLSTNSWASNGSEPTSLDSLMHVNQTTMAHPLLTSSDYVQVEQPPSESRMHSLDLHNNGSSQFQEFQLFKAPYDSRCFYSNQIN